MPIRAIWIQANTNMRFQCAVPSEKKICGSKLVKNIKSQAGKYADTNEVKYADPIEKYYADQSTQFQVRQNMLNLADPAVTFFFIITIITVTALNEPQILSSSRDGK